MLCWAPSGQRSHDLGLGNEQQLTHLLYGRLRPAVDHGERGETLLHHRGPRVDLLGDTEPLQQSGAESPAHDHAPSTTPWRPATRGAPPTVCGSASRTRRRDPSVDDGREVGEAAGGLELAGIGLVAAEPECRGDMEGELVAAMGYAAA
ncbi:hypothetical protein [Streptomyces sp. NPDC006645]|uniref:hypothetical protein n=1 Tax=unclassified Streptomyces TaxID=2593676 RepID=UPI0033A2F5C0